MRVRKGLVGVFGAAGMLVVSASLAWACVSAGGPFQGEVVPNKAPVLASAQVSGGGWSASSPVEIGWATSPSAAITPLSTAMADGSGKVAATVKVPSVEPGFYYLVTTQGATTKAMPFEVTGARRVAVAAAPAPGPGNEPGAAKAWNGLRAGDTNVPGLADLPGRTQSSASPWPAVGIAAGVSVLLAGLAVAEVRRRRVAAHAELRH